MTEFKKFPKIYRSEQGKVTITEKIDGTNAGIILSDGVVVGCQSRNRILSLDNDHMGFCKWVEEWKGNLVDLYDWTRPPTEEYQYVYGEWAGPGIRKNRHGLAVKTFFVFNPDLSSSTPNVYNTPVLYSGTSDGGMVQKTLQTLYDSGSTITPPKKAEGVVCYWHNTGWLTKETFDGPKWKNKS